MVLAFPIIIVGSHFEKVYSEFREKDLARRNMLTGDSLTLLKYLQRNRKALAGQIADISQFFMLLEKPTEADAATFRNAIEELQSTFEKFDSLNNHNTEQSEQLNKKKTSMSLVTPEVIVVAGAHNNLEIPEN